ncbi:hypothetical protein Peur_063784 [Populus x canadensis]
MVNCLYYRQEPTKDTCVKFSGNFSLWRESIRWDTFNCSRGVAQYEIWYSLLSSARSQEFINILTLTAVYDFPALLLCYLGSVLWCRWCFAITVV